MNLSKRRRKLSCDYCRYLTRSKCWKHYRKPVAVSVHSEKIGVYIIMALGLSTLFITLLLSLIPVVFFWIVYAIRIYAQHFNPLQQSRMFSDWDLYNYYFGLAGLTFAFVLYRGVRRIKRIV